MVAWEVTRRCNLSCVHCRASALHGPYPGELDTQACLRLLDEIAAFSQPIIILTGGEPLLREDIFEIADYGNKKGLRMVLATNGTLLTEEMVKKMLPGGNPAGQRQHRRPGPGEPRRLPGRPRRFR